MTDLATALSTINLGSPFLVAKPGKANTLTLSSGTLTSHAHLSPQISDRLLGKLVGAGATTPASPVESLSDRELEVLHLLGQGMTTSKIADKLCLSVKTVETYREHLKQKLHLSSGPELLRYAIEWSLAQTR